MAKQPEPVAEDAPKKGGGLKRLLTLILVAAIMGGGGFGAGIYYSGEQLSPSQEVLRLIERDQVSTEGTEAADGPPEKVARERPTVEEFITSYYEFPEPLTTNLKNSRRYLQVGIGLSTQYDQQVIDNVTNHSLALQSDILAVISSFTEADVEGVEGREALSNAIRDAVNNRLEKLEGFGGIESVFFPSFVMQ